MNWHWDIGTDPRCAMTDPVPPALRISKLHAHAHTQINNTSGFNSRAGEAKSDGQLYSI